MVTSIFVLSGCSSKNTTTEYDIEEFGKMYEETEELFEEKAAYLTDEEKYGEKGYSIYKECSKQTGLPFNQEIILRGKKESAYRSMIISSSDGEHEIWVSMPVGKDTGIFVNNGESVVVKGNFSKGVGSCGVFSDVVFQYPSDIDDSYKGNTVAEVISSLSDEDFYTNVVVYGEITDLLTLEELKDSLGSSLTDDLCFGDSAMRIDCEDGGTGTVYSIYYKDFVEDLSVGDKIAIQGDIIGSGVEIGGTYIPLFGIIYSTDNYYNFSE